MRDFSVVVNLGRGERLLCLARYVVAPSLLPLMLRAQRAEAAENEHELRVLETPTVETIDGLLAANAVERDAEDHRNADLLARRARLTLETK